MSRVDVQDRSKALDLGGAGLAESHVLDRVETPRCCGYWVLAVRVGLLLGLQPELLEQRGLELAWFEFVKAEMCAQLKNCVVLKM